MIGRDNFTGRKASLVAEDVERLQRAMDARPVLSAGDRRTAELVDGYGISRRSLYRYWPGRVEWVEVDGYRFAFLIRPGRRPTLLSTRRDG